MPRFLYRDVRELAVRADRDGMRLRKRYRGNHSLCRGLDKDNAVFAVHRDQQQSAVGRERHAVWRLADFDCFHDFVDGRIDDVERGRSVPAYINGAAVLRYRHAVRAGGNRNGRDHLANLGIDHAHRVVFEIGNVSLCCRGGECWLDHLRTGSEYEQANSYQRIEPSNAGKHLYIGPSHFLVSSYKCR